MTSGTGHIFASYLIAIKANNERYIWVKPPGILMWFSYKYQGQKGGGVGPGAMTDHSVYCVNTDMDYSVVQSFLTS